MKTVVVAAMVFAATASLFAVYFGSPPDRPKETKPLVVAAADLAAFETLTNPRLRLARCALDAYPAGGLQAVEQAVGKRTLHRIAVNEPVTLGRITDEPPAIEIQRSVPKGFRAVALDANNVDGLSGPLEPGSKVDVLVLDAFRDGARRPLATALENAPVLAFEKDGSAQATGSGRGGPVIRLLLNSAEAELLKLAMARGRLRLSVREALDAGKVAAAWTAARSPDSAPSSVPARPPLPAAPPSAEPSHPEAVSIEIIRGDRRELQRLEVGEN